MASFSNTRSTSRSTTTRAWTSLSTSSIRLPIRVTGSIATSLIGTRYRRHFTLRPDTTYDTVIQISDIQASSESGAPTDLDVSQQSDQLVMRIGDPDRTIIGEHEYTLSYHVVGAMNSFNNHDELNWNAIGNNWTVPI